MNPEAYKKVAAGRLRASDSRPYLSSALFALNIIEVDGLSEKAAGPIAVDQHWRLYYDPEVVMNFDAHTMEGCIIHEISHLLREHHKRANAMGVEMLRWNIAADCEINDDLKAEGLKLPEFGVWPSTFGMEDDKLAEHYYHKLPKQPQGQGDGQTKGKSQGSGTAGGDCGSCVTGETGDYEEPADSENGALGEMEQELVRRNVAQEIKDHAKSRGDIPAHWKRWADEKLESKVNWRQELAASVRNALGSVSGMVDYSYSRPARRQSTSPRIVLPALRKPNPSIAFVIDTSGSMSDRELAMGITEVGAVLKQMGATEGVRVLAVDAAVAVSRQVFNLRQVMLRGGGGTDMGVGLDAVAKMRPQPHVCIVITDGWTPWPAKNPLKGKVIICVTQGAPEETPSWAKRIVLER
jgi:predicted metal-dependent peptidase